MRAFSKVAVVLAGASVVAAGVPALASADSAAKPSADVATYSPVAASSDFDAAAFWTPERMAAAKPIESTLPSTTTMTPLTEIARGAEGRAAPAPTASTKYQSLVGTDTGSTATHWRGGRKTPPASTSGKVFFVADDGAPYVCSAGTVNSGGKDVVFTAGHCVHGGGSGRAWYDASKWTFVPSYNGKKKNPAPYGYWTAYQLWSLNGWTQSADRAYDIGAVVMQTDGWGRHIVDVVGGQGMEWNYPLEQYMYQFGYPSRYPFMGNKLQYCSNWTYDDGGFEGINCDMTEGASGGSWLDDFDGTFGYLDGVNSWVFWDGAGTRYKWNSPYFGEAAHNLYLAVADL
jgi:V8-like Glu-specific endopeptidase